MDGAIIKYPYIPKNKKILYVGIDNKFMRLARDFAKKHSLDDYMPGAAVIVKDGVVVGEGANGSKYHDKHPCRRKDLGLKTGEGYELCEGCHPNNHSEVASINNAKDRGNKKGLTEANLYLWGHWWCCKPCWEAMIEVDIRNVYLLKDSEKLFNKDHPDNIIGKQFAY